MDKGIEFLLDALENQNKRVMELRKREIELLTSLLKAEETMQSMTSIIAELKYPKLEPKKDSNIPVIQKDITEPEENQKEAVKP